MKIAAVVTDVEGTTSGISFFREVLYPFVLRNIAVFLREHQDERDVARVLVRLSKNNGIPAHETEAIIRLLQKWIKEDQNVTELKALEGMVLEKGYRQGLFQGHVYPDVPAVLQEWQKQERNLYTFSPASVKAQQLFFRYSSSGDMRLLFSGYYDSNMGARHTAQTYLNIAEGIALKPAAILYISDDRQELDAAAQAGMQTCWVLRPQDTSLDPERIKLKSSHQVVSSFEEIVLD